MVKWLSILTALLLWAGLGVLLAGQKQHTGQAESAPGRIVCLAPNLTEILFALGLEDRIAAVSSDSNWPAAATQKPTVGTFWPPNIEAIIATKPDLVVTLGFQQQKNVARRLRRMGYNTLTLKIESIRELFAAIDKIGVVTVRQNAAEDLTKRIKAELNNISTMLANRPKLKVLWVMQTEPLRAAGRDTFINELIEFAGGENAIGRTIHQYPPIGAEQVIASAPDVIIQPAMGPADLAKQQAAAEKFWNSKKWQNVPAAKNGRIYVVPADTVSRLGPRIYHGAETIGRCLHPEVFDVNTTNLRLPAEINND